MGWYTTLDTFLGGMLPAGAPFGTTPLFSTPGQSAYGMMPGAQPSWYESLDAYLGGLLPGGAAGTPFMGSAAQYAGYQQPQPMMGMPGTMPAMMPAPGPAVPRGRRMTIEVDVMPGGQVVPKRVHRGGVALLRSDFGAYRRVKKFFAKYAPKFRPRAAAKSRKR